MSWRQLALSAVAVAGCQQAAFRQPLGCSRASHPVVHSLPPYRTSNKSAFLRDGGKTPSKMSFEAVDFRWLGEQLRLHEVQ